MVEYSHGGLDFLAARHCVLSLLKKKKMKRCHIIVGISILTSESNRSLTNEMTPTVASSWQVKLTAIGVATLAFLCSGTGALAQHLELTSNLTTPHNGERGPAPITFL